MTIAHAHVEVTYTYDMPHRVGLAFLDCVETLVGDEIRNLFTSLGLESDLVELDFVSDRAAKDGAVSVAVDGEPCGTCSIDSAATSAALANAIFALVFANRDVLITQEVALEIWDRLTGKNPSPTGLEASRIRDLIRRAALFGCPPAKALQQYEQMLADGVDELLRMAAIEPFLSNTGEEVAVFVPEAAQQWNYSEQAERICEEVFYRSGVTLGAIVLKTCETPLQEGRGEFRLQYGALVGPVRSAGVLEPEALQQAVSVALAEDVHLRFSVHDFERTLASFIEAFPMPVFNAVEKLGTNKVLQVLRLLLEERVSIGDLRGILGAMLELNGSIALDDEHLETYRPTDSRLVPRTCGTPDGPLTNEEFADYVRIRLRHQLCWDLVNADTAKLVAHRVSGNVEARLKAAGVHPMSAVEEALLSAAVASVLGENGDSGVLLTSFTLRRSLWHMLRRRFPRLRVLCRQELSPHVAFQIESDVDCVLPELLRMDGHPRP